MAKRKAARKTATRSETVSVRLEPRLRFLADLAARKQRRTLSSYIEWAVEKSLASVEVDRKGRTIVDLATFLWDVDDADRFIKLAINHEDLLNHDEQVLWKLIKDSRISWCSCNDPADFFRLFSEASEATDSEFARRSLDKGEILDIKNIRLYWPKFLAVAQGKASPDSLLIN